MDELLTLKCYMFKELDLRIPRKVLKPPPQKILNEKLILALEASVGKFETGG